MAKFEVISEYSPSGDQPKAIEILSKFISLNLHTIFMYLCKLNKFKCQEFSL